MMESKLIPIVFSFTNNYFIPVCVSIQSILSHSSTEIKYEFICLVGTDFDENKQAKINKLIGNRGCAKFIYLDESILNGIEVNKRYSVFAYYRLLLPNILSSYDQVIYLDSDVLVNLDISTLFRDIQLKNYLLGAVYEPTLPEQVNHLSAINFSKNEYFNSGVLFLNLELMRKEHTVDSFIYQLKSESLLFPDQDVLNIACRGKVLPLPAKYNAIRTFFIPDYKENFISLYSEKDWNDIKKESIMHYTGRAIKPWERYCVNFKYWWKVYNSLPNYIKDEWNLNRKLFMLYKFESTKIGQSLINFLKKIK